MALTIEKAKGLVEVPNWHLDWKDGHLPYRLGEQGFKK
jgi:hypothetical protein